MNFYWQRDPRWAHKKIGQSPYTLGQKGCVTSNVATSGSWFKEDTTPGQLADTLKYTPEGNLIWSSIGRIYKNQEFLWRMYQLNFSQNMIDEALRNPNKTVQLNVDRGTHWVFALRRIPMTTKYWVFDPWDNKKKFYSGAIGCAIMKKK